MRSILTSIFMLCAFLFTPTFLQAGSLGECVQACADQYLNCDDQVTPVPVTPPIVPPVTPGLPTAIFPDTLEFEETTSAGLGIYKGTAAALLPTRWEGKTIGITLNGEVGALSTSYKGRPVVRFTKVGSEYPRPLVFFIYTTEGNYAFVIGTTPVGPVTPVPVTPTPGGPAAIFPDTPVFEETTDAGTGAYKGTAAVLLSARWEGKVKGVTLNGEVGALSASYKGRPVIRFKKVGGEYARPLVLWIYTTEGDYTFVSGDASNPGTGGGGADGEYRTASGVYDSYGERNGGRKAWRVNKKGPAFGKRCKVVFSDGHTVYVNDTSHNYREKDGFVFKPGIGPNGTGDADTGTAHGGVYLHAPYGNKSMKVQFFY